MKENNLDLDKCLEEAKLFHGSLCAGARMGVRMSILGLNAIGINDPKGKDRKSIMVFVEMDRCAADAILSVTGCRPGKRTMKIMNYGKMAATFINLNTGKAVRVVERNNDGDKLFTREMIQNSPRTVDYLKRTDDELFSITEVKVEISPEDMPGPPLKSVPCAICGERILDMRDVTVDGKYLCRPCAESNRYYSPVDK